VFSLFNSVSSADRALTFAQRALDESGAEGRAAVLARVFQLAYGRGPSAEESAACLAHWEQMIAHHEKTAPRRTEYPTEVEREAVDENTGQRFTFTEKLQPYRDFVPDLQPADASVEARALAEICLVILNSNEFVYVY
jgi:hypothetical protein